MRVTESMLAQIADMNAPDEDNLAPQPRELVDPTVCVAMTAEQRKSLLVSISSDVPRGNGSIDVVGTTDYWLGVVWAIAGLGLDEGKTIARDWSATSSRYSEEDFETAWDSFDSSHPNPIGIGSVLKLAKTLEVKTSAPSLD